MASAITAPASISIARNCPLAPVFCQAAPTSCRPFRPRRKSVVAMMNSSGALARGDAGPAQDVDDDATGFSAAPDRDRPRGHREALRRELDRDVARGDRAVHEWMRTVDGLCLAAGIGDDPEAPPVRFEDQRVSH